MRNTQKKKRQKSDKSAEEPQKNPEQRHKRQGEQTKKNNGERTRYRHAATGDAFHRRRLETSGGKEPFSSRPVSENRQKKIKQHIRSQLGKAT